MNKHYYQKLKNKDRRNWKNEFKEEWITKGINEECIKFSDDFGKHLAQKGLSSSQIRNIFGEVKRIQMKLTGSKEEWKSVKSSFLLLKPKLAYVQGRARSREFISEFRIVLDAAINAVDADKEGAIERYQHFVDFFESILAYHKAYGGKE